MGSGSRTRGWEEGQEARSTDESDDAKRDSRAGHQRESRRDEHKQAPLDEPRIIVGTARAIRKGWE